MNRIEFNLATGEQKVVSLTKKEIAEAQARHQEELGNPYIRAIKAALKGQLWVKNKFKSKL